MKTRWNWIPLIVGGLLLGACSVIFPRRDFAPGAEPRLEGPADAANGERIYFTASSARNGRITYRGGPNFGGMMMGNYLTCAACHGPEAHGGIHYMHMQVMDAPDISFEALSSDSDEHGGAEHDEEDGEYALEDFRRAVVDGEHPDGEALSREMPRWQMNEADLADLLKFLKMIP